MGLLDFFKRGKVEEELVVETVPTTSNVNVNTTSGDFSFTVEDVFTITGRGTVVTGRVASGSISVGEHVLINGTLETEVTGIEMFRKTLDTASAGDNCGILLRGISREQISQGDTLTK